MLNKLLSTASRRSLNTFARCAVTLLVIVAVVTAASTAFACPTCKDSLGADDPGAQAMARGYFFSIIFMMAMPFVLVGTFGGAAYLSIRRAREQQLTSSLDASDSNTEPRSQ